MPALPAKKEGGYTYEDYLRFPDDLRCEIIEGEIYDMTPSPTFRHQNSAGTIYHLVRSHLDCTSLPCRVVMAPMDVVFSEKDTVQPDVLIVCDSTKIKESGIFGAPDVIFEVLSPSTERKDRLRKRRLYERSGVKEYFLVNPVSEFIEKYTLSDTTYGIPNLYEEKETFVIEAIGLELAVSDLFPE